MRFNALTERVIPLGFSPLARFLEPRLAGVLYAS